MPETQSNFAGTDLECYRLARFKGSRMGHSVKVSLWCVTLLINIRFRFFFYFRISNCLAHLMLHKGKELPNDLGRLSSYNNFTDKNKMAAAKKQCFLRFLYLTESSSLVRGLQMTINLALV